jgi:hypothetical protein
VLAAGLVSPAAEVLGLLPWLPVGDRESADPEEHDCGDEYADAGAEYRSVDPGGAVIEHVDGKSQQTEGDLDRDDRAKDPLRRPTSRSLRNSGFAPGRKLGPTSVR